MRVFLYSIIVCGLGMVATFVATNSFDTQPTKAAVQTTTSNAVDTRPSIVMILADDLDLKLDSLNYMPNLQALIAQQGTTFTQSIVTESLCCPSRSTILRGQYVHNHQILNNEYPTGGYRKFSESGHESSNLGVWLQSGGYNTTFLGKYLNGYPLQGEPTHVPIGWTGWFGGLGANIYDMNNYQLNENGVVTSYGATSGEYLTDVMSNKAVSFINQNSTNTTPFFLYLNPTAPHIPATPAPRHATLFPTAQVPRSPSFNETDVSDKPAQIRNQPLLNQNQINNLDTNYRSRIRSMQAVDEMIASIVQTLQTTGRLNNTYIVFASDNGFHMGQHRMPQGKATAYEEDVVVPLVIRGPNVPVNQTLSNYMVGNIDFAPTFADIAGVSVPSFVDGRSFKSLLTNNPPPANSWRQYFLIEQYPFATPEIGDQFPSSIADKNQGKANAAGTNPTTIAVRTTRYKYVEWYTGERELYDLQTDPYELSNFYPTGDPNLIAKLSLKLAELKTCVGEQCRTIESEARPPFDFDGDGRSDISVFRPSDRVWYINQSTAGFSAAQFGLSTDKITPADYDGDGKTDIAVYRDGVWYRLNSTNGTVGIVQFGIVGDIPQSADFTGDGRAEIAVYRNGTWWTLDLTNNQVNVTQFGNSTDKPVVGDYDSDGRADQAVYRGNGEWHLNRSTQGYTVVNFGLSTDKLVPADYDGDGKTDEAVYRDGTWYVLQSNQGFTAFQWGISTDIPVPADYDGDGRTDIAVYRNGTWYIRQSSNGSTSFQQFGLRSDIPIAVANVQ